MEVLYQMELLKKITAISQQLQSQELSSWKSHFNYTLMMQQTYQYVLLVEQVVQVEMIVDGSGGGGGQGRIGKFSLA